MKGWRGRGASAPLMLSAALVLLLAAVPGAVSSAQEGVTDGEPVQEQPQEGVTTGEPVQERQVQRSAAETVARVAGVPFREVGAEIWSQLEELPGEGIVGSGPVLPAAQVQMEAAAAAATFALFSAAYDGLEARVEACRNAPRPGCLEEVTAELAIAVARLIAEGEEGLDGAFSGLSEDRFEVFSSPAQAQSFSREYRQRLQREVVSALEVAASSDARPAIRAQAQEALTLIGFVQDAGSGEEG